MKALLFKDGQTLQIKVEDHPEAKAMGEIHDFYGYTGGHWAENDFFRISVGYIVNYKSSEPSHLVIVDDAGDYHLIYAQTFLDFAELMHKLGVIPQYEMFKESPDWG